MSRKPGPTTRARGQSHVTTASTQPGRREEVTSFDSGVSQTKCRLMKYPRMDGKRFLTQIVTATSNNPPARPHHKEQQEAIQQVDPRTPAGLRADSDLERSRVLTQRVVLVKNSPVDQRTR